MTTFKILALAAAMATSAFALPAFAVKVCNRDMSCQSPNGPSLDGLVVEVRDVSAPLSIKVCNRDNSCQSPNGPSLDGLVDEVRDVSAPLSIKTCNRDNSCQSPNGPDVSGRKDNQSGKLPIGIEMPQ